MNGSPKRQQLRGEDDDDKPRNEKEPKIDDCENFCDFFFEGSNEDCGRRRKID
jgi:hypothetical protein